jgi:hypothetical protein
MKNLIPFKGQNHSGATDLNLLVQVGKSFVMDNHLAAGWCWMQEVVLTQRYNLFHIDRHYDLSAHVLDQWLRRLEELNFDHAQISIEDLLKIRFIREDNPQGGDLQLFRWDNYITIVDRLYPQLFERKSFATQKDGDIPDGFEIVEHEPYSLPENLGYWLEADGKTKAILNLDIDYFFIHHGDSIIQFFDDEYIRVIAREISSAWNHIEVFTLCLSPECCGGWDNAVRVANIITGELGLEWEMK